MKLSRRHERGFFVPYILWVLFWPAAGVFVATAVHPQRVDLTRDMAAVLRDKNGKPIPYTPEVRVREDRNRRLILTEAELVQLNAERRAQP